MTQIVVEGSGPIDPGHLADAVGTASAACPGARLERDGMTWVDSGRTPPVHVLDVPDLDAAGATRLLAARAPLGGPGEPMCAVTVLTGQVTAVAFQANHAVMDAKGLVTWALDVFRALRGEPLLGAADPVSDRDVPADGPAVTPGSPDAGHVPVLGACGATERSRVCCGRRAVQGTFPGLVARLATALVEHAAVEAGLFSVPVDLRPYRSGVRTTANMTSSIDLPVWAGEQWDRVHERLLRALADGEPTRTVPPAELLYALSIPQLNDAINATDRAARSRGVFPANAIVSHAGRVALADVSTPGFAAHTVYELSRPVPGGPPELAAVEVDGHTEITMSWWDGPDTTTRIEALLDHVARRLSPVQPQRAGEDTVREFPYAGGVVELFTRRAAQTPDAIALDGPQGPVTYAQLAHRCAVVADRLLAEGVGPDTVVGVLADRTVSAMVAIWGVLRAGAAYLPLDGQLPDARITELLTEAGARVCLTQRPHDRRNVVPGGCAGLVIEELDWSVPTPEVDVRPARTDLAYVIYTSGSTGRPKGVEIEHRGLANYVRWATREYRIGKNTRLPLIVSLSFDLSGNGIFLPLVAGGTVVLWPAQITHQTLRALLTEAGATALSLTPSHLDLIGRLDVTPRGFTSIVVIGEQLRRSVAVRAQRMFGPDCEIINSYGPTEVTIGMTTHRFDENTDVGSVVPIGLPTDNNTVVLLDAHDRFVPAGEPGELCLGGVQVARGYRGRPDLSRLRFPRLADGERVYRTGDIAMVLPSGELEFVGRTDDQVKVLGHRIEPAEIAQALERHPAVAGAVVVPRSPGGQAHKALCAYVVPGADIDRDTDRDAALVRELTEHVARLLPRYMVPAVTTLVDRIPQTGNGKVDVRGLPDPFGPDHSGGAVGGRDQLGDEVARIWSNVLGVAPQRMADTADFHQLGGNSMLLLAMLAQVSGSLVGADAEGRFMTELSEIVREPTLAHVTDIVRRVRDAE
jgi:amino acid adenylation domain-containing protein